MKAALDETTSQTGARFAAGLTTGEIPDSVLTSAKLHLMDAIGCAVAASGLELGTAARAVALEMGGNPDSSVIGADDRLPAATAAFANGMLCHALDFDDTHTASGTHVGAVVVPAAIAVAEQVGASGPDLLAAIVVGSEIVTRVGMAAPFAFHHRGLHTTSVCGVFGATCAAARLYGLDATTTAHALGIAGSFASGLFECLADGSTTKQTHAGWAAQAGIVAARLAAHGTTGPMTVFEGSRGVYAALGDTQEPQLADQLADLGQRWETPMIAFKPYPACQYIHASLDALRLAIQDDDFSTVDEVDQVVASVPHNALVFVLEPVSEKIAPRNPYDAKFSLQYSLAAMLVDGSVGVETYTPGRIGDSRVLDLARRVTYEVKDFPSYPQAFPGGVRVRMRSGRDFEAEVPYQRGGDENPLTAEDVRAKFIANARLGLSESAAGELTTALWGLEDEGSVVGLFSRLADAAAQPELTAAV